MHVTFSQVLLGTKKEVLAIAYEKLERSYPRFYVADDHSQTANALYISGKTDLQKFESIIPPEKYTHLMSIKDVGQNTGEKPIRYRISSEDYQKAFQLFEAFNKDK